jgi:hypothetical protein
MTSPSRREQAGLEQPRLVRMTQEQEHEAVRLLAELFFDAAARTRRGSSPSGFGSVIDGASGSVVPFPEKRGNARDAA